MFEFIALLIGTGAATGAAVGGYMTTRNFVRRRLRYVDDVRRPGIPVITGVVATAAAIPVVALLPIIGAGTALVFGGAVGMGTLAGVRELRKEDAGY